MKKLEWMKKMGVMTLAMAMTAGMLTGCGSSSEPAADSASDASSAETDAATDDAATDASDAGSAVEAIKARGVLHYGTEDSALGFGYLNPETNEYEGLEADLGRLIAQELGVDVEFTTVVTNTRGPLIDSGDVDMVAATFTITDERKQSYDFTEPYYVDAQSVLVNKDSGLKTIDDFDGKKIAMSAGGTEKDSISAITDANIEFVEFADFSEAKLALTAGTVDGFAADSSILQSYVDDDTEFIETKFSPQPYGIATKKGSDLSAYVNELVQKWLEDGTIDGLIEKNGIQPSYEEPAATEEPAAEATDAATEEPAAEATDAATDEATDEAAE
ncbi:transporter substrate-binding domain-containing protein [Kineothrix sp. MSJ-39]|uniref:transporter substrate-binding domain-containing protein n=1 Tax=Kineothrix sp. MSJ-39 TaxID=2841533 RepID=UPI001C10EE9D|nr:transporter substrate-binding domain-containing protein [Kineothrix sp. MSJ-39]MBU5430062.1 transporter substrate-binding domain-containing protein [Kineothrix sp. MSJ-39]